MDMDTADQIVCSPKRTNDNQDKSLFLINSTLSFSRIRPHHNESSSLSFSKVDSTNTVKTVQLYAASSPNPLLAEFKAQ